MISLLLFITLESHGEAEGWIYRNQPIRVVGSVHFNRTSCWRVKQLWNILQTPFRLKSVSDHFYNFPPTDNLTFTPTVIRQEGGRVDLFFSDLSSSFLSLLMSTNTLDVFQQRLFENVHPVLKPWSDLSVTLFNVKEGNLNSVTFTGNSTLQVILNLFAHPPSLQPSLLLLFHPHLSLLFLSSSSLPSVFQSAMSNPQEEPSAAVSALLSSALSAAVSAAMAVAMSVDAKADLATLLDEWEEAQQGTTEQLVSILTKSAEISFVSWDQTQRASC